MGEAVSGVECPLTMGPVDSYVDRDASLRKPQKNERLRGTGGAAGRQQEQARTSVITRYLNCKRDHDKGPIRAGPVACSTTATLTHHARPQFHCSTGRTSRGTMDRWIGGRSTPSRRRTILMDFWFVPNRLALPSRQPSLALRSSARSLARRSPRLRHSFQNTVRSTSGKCGLRSRKL